MAKKSSRSTKQTRVAAKSQVNNALSPPTKRRKGVAKQESRKGLTGREKEKRNDVDPVVPKEPPPDLKGIGDVTLRRKVMITDFGAYLKQLRIDKGLEIKDVAPDIGFTENTVYRIEASKRHPPSEDRLKIWLTVIGQSAKIPEALRLLRSVKRSRRVEYHINDPVNEHIDRILEAYENRRLTVLDHDLLSMIALAEYTK